MYSVADAVPPPAIATSAPMSNERTPSGFRSGAGRITELTPAVAVGSTVREYMSSSAGGRKPSPKEARNDSQGFASQTAASLPLKLSKLRRP